MKPASATAVLLLLSMNLAACERPSSREQPPAKALPAAASPRALPERVVGGAPDAPATLPSARTCRQALAQTWDVDKLPGQVNGALVRGAAALRRLRRDWGDALIVVRGGDFSGADLRGARLHNICFVETKFVGSDLSRAEAPGAGFFWSDLTQARLAGASLPNVVFETPHLERVDAAGADLSGGRMSGNAFGAWDGLRLDRADLRGFRFECPPVEGEQCAGRAGAISFRGADLRGAWIDTYRGDGDWRGARFGDTRVSLRQLRTLGSIGRTGSLIVYERPAQARLSAAEYDWLRRHTGVRGDRAPIESHRRKVTGPAPWMRHGAEALFVAPAVEFDAAARRSRLYRRLMSAIVAGAISYVRVAVDRRGRVAVSGSAVGSNAHMCSIGARQLRLERQGWYYGVGHRPGGRSTEIPVIRFWADRAEVYEGGHPADDQLFFDGIGELVSCGARAGFEEMVRVPFPPAGAHRLWHEAGMDAG